MTQRLSRVVPAGLLAIIFACGLAAQAATSDDYDTFMQQDVKGRLAAFQHLSAEQKADLVRTHVTRWVDVHRSRLTDAQLQITQEWIDYATAENYREPLSKRPAAAAQLKTWNSAPRLFSRSSRWPKPFQSNARTFEEVGPQPHRSMVASFFRRRSSDESSQPKTHCSPIAVLSEVL